jgi:hypothetical protein
VRPTTEDRDALRLLLAHEDLSDWEAEFIESLRNWTGPWTAKQQAAFDALWEQYYG